MYRNVLVAIDGTPSSAKALDHAQQLAAALNATLTIVSVVPPMPSFAYRTGIDVNALEAQATEEAGETLRGAADGSPESISVRTRLRKGRPAEEIVAEAREGDHDLVVVGSRGRGRLASTVLGSVAGGVHFHLQTPLLVIPADNGDAD